MTIGRICIREVDLAEPRERVRAAARRMAARGVGSLVVVDEKRRPTGIVTDRDLLLRVMARGEDPDVTLVEEAMTRGVRTITEDAPIEDSLERMRLFGVRRLPVVDERGVLVGILSFDDVLAHLIEELGSMRGILERSSPAVVAQE